MEVEHEIKIRQISPAGDASKVGKQTEKVKKAAVQHLPWYKTRWWDGFLRVMIGMPLAFLFYKLVVVVVRCFEAS